jgi:hypothetical protein
MPLLYTGSRERRIIPKDPSVPSHPKDPSVPSHRMNSTMPSPMSPPSCSKRRHSPKGTVEISLLHSYPAHVRRHVHRSLGEGGSPEWRCTLALIRAQKSTSRAGEVCIIWEGRVPPRPRHARLRHSDEQSHLVQSPFPCRDQSGAINPPEITCTTFPVALPLTA